MSVRLPFTKSHCATLICVYAPTMQYPGEDNNKFYSQFRTAIEGVPRKDKLMVISRPGLVQIGLPGRASWGDMELDSAILMVNCFLRHAWPTIFTSQTPTSNQCSKLGKKVTCTEKKIGCTAENLGARSLHLRHCGV